MICLRVCAVTAYRQALLNPVMFFSFCLRTTDLKGKSTLFEVTDCITDYPVLRRDLNVCYGVCFSKTISFI